jgi:hypothetical protein
MPETDTNQIRHVPLTDEDLTVLVCEMRRACYRAQANAADQTRLDRGDWAQHSVKLQSLTRHLGAWLSPRLPLSSKDPKHVYVDHTGCGTPHHAEGAD